MSRIVAKMGDDMYIVEESGSFRRRSKIKEVAGCDISSDLINNWSEWEKTQENLKSINEDRVKQYKKERVKKSFRILRARTWSSKEPEGWTQNMTNFVRESNPDENLVDLVVRFEERFPLMKDSVGKGWFDSLRRVVSSDDEWY